MIVVARAVAVCVLILLLGAVNVGCGYYSQAIGGQLEILSKRQSIETLIDNPETDPTLRSQLTKILEIRAFASAELGLPDNKSYRTYADLERRYVVWNVFAAPELSLEPLEWCFVFVGCLNYRGYFSPEGAQRFADELRQQDYDVYVAGIAAYSTLGWFHDPVLNTILRNSEPDVAGLIFHELAHQRVYVRDDTTFNESFAMTVEIEGVKRWLARTGSKKQFQAYLQRKELRGQFIDLIEKYRERLGHVYASARSDQQKRKAKAAVFDDLRGDYRKLKQGWDGYAGYDAWFAQDLNNAYLVPVGLYQQYVPAFKVLLAQHDGSLPAFYAAVEALGELPKAERVARLKSLRSPARSR
ncbi:MAG: aminopeptidase [Acidiferrobacterales bacterium]